MWILVEGGGQTKWIRFLFVFLFSATPFDQNFLVKIEAVHYCYFDFLLDPTLLNFLPK